MVSTYWVNTIVCLVTIPRRGRQRLLQGRELAVRGARHDAGEEALNVGPFLGGERPALDLRDLLRIGNLIRRLVVRRVLVQADKRCPVAALNGIEMFLERGAKRPKAARETSAVDRHHEPDCRALGC